MTEACPPATGGCSFASGPGDAQCQDMRWLMLLGMALCACGSDNSGTSGSGGTSANPEFTITLQGTGPDPAAATVVIGTTVIFVNATGQALDISSTDCAQLDGAVGAGGSARVGVGNKTGTCHYSAGGNGVLTVTDRSGGGGS